jgi:peptidoglycan/xylan/chitin deacetylase (PgdA/CDA1 family)
MGSARTRPVWRRRPLLGAAAPFALAFAVTGQTRPLLATGGSVDPADGGQWIDGLDDYVGFVEVPRYFPATGHNVTGELMAYFYRHGGVDTFGYPLTEEFWMPGKAAAADGGLMVQYFQRARLAYDPEEHTVHRSPLGEWLISQQPAVVPAPGLRYFPETGHNLGQGFLVFFEQAGGIDVLGYPISEEVWEHGHTVQWFQNARLEWWPETEPAHQFQYGLVGEEHLLQVLSEVPPEALDPAPPLPPVREWTFPRQLPGHRPIHVALPAPILYYHHVPSQAALRAQVQAFRAAGRTIVPLSTVVDAVRGEGALPERPLVLTFDDGWASQYHHAAPVLQAEGVPATFFVITRYLGELPGYMSWDHVRVLKELGHEVECHTQNHPSLDSLHAEDEGAAIAEIWESLAILEGRLGRSRRLFAYPNGRWNQSVVSLVARVYRGAVATGGGAMQHPDQLFWLSRIKAETFYRPESLIRQFP